MSMTMAMMMVVVLMMMMVLWSRSALPACPWPKAPAFRAECGAAAHYSEYEAGSNTEESVTWNEFFLLVLHVRRAVSCTHTNCVCICSKFKGNKTKQNKIPIRRPPRWITAELYLQVNRRRMGQGSYTSIERENVLQNSNYFEPYTQGFP